MSALSLQARPALDRLFVNYTRVLFSRNWQVLLAIGIPVWIYHFATLRGDPGGAEITLFVNGGLSFSGGIIMTLITLLWSSRVWNDLPPGERETFLAYPVDRTVHYLMRMAAGLGLLLAIIITGWILSGLCVECIHPGSSWFSDPLLRGSGWPISLIGIVNAYLLGSIFALLFRQPILWFMFGILIVNLPFILAVAPDTLLWQIMVNPLSYILLYPYGLFSGLGIAWPSLAATDSFAGLTPHLPALTIVLLWTVILGLGLAAASRFRRER